MSDPHSSKERYEMIQLIKGVRGRTLASFDPLGGGGGGGGGGKTIELRRRRENNRIEEEEGKQRIAGFQCHAIQNKNQNNSIDQV